MTKTASKISAPAMATAAQQVTVGDNLDEAASFVRFGKTIIEHHVSGIAFDGEKLIQDLTDLIGQAQALKARAVLRIAHLAVTEIKSPTCNRNVVQGHLVTLYKLINQYGSGLTELRPELFEMVDKPSDNSTVAALPPMPTHTEQRPPLAIFDKDAQRDFEQAKDTLSGLIHHAPTAKNREALSRLSAINLFGEMPQAKPVAKTAQNFDTIMPELTGSILRQARHYGKTVSVSYSADGVSLSPDCLETLHTGLKTFSTKMVADYIDRPQERERAGLSQAAHIALTVRRHGDHYNLLMTCDGKDRPAKTLTESVDLLHNISKDVRVSCEDGLVKLDMRRIPSKTVSTSTTDSPTPSPQQEALA